MRSRRSEAVGLAAGAVADAVFADPQRGHPVAVFGSAVAASERRVYADARGAGAAFAAGWIGVAAAVGAVLRRGGAVGTAAATFAALGGTSLCRVGEDIADALDAGDVEEARRLVSGLVARDPNLLDEAGICRAAVESIAENTSDAAIGPLVFGAVAGPTGVLAYRAVNTLDAMVGYRSDRYRNFGWAAARIDDAANLVPARVTALAVAAVAGRPRAVREAVRRDAGKHPSPNAGVVEAAFAGALDIELGGRTVYAYGVEERPRLGTGRAPTASDLRAAVRLSRRVQMLTAASAVAARWALATSRSAAPTCP
ncbi:cobalamin biosynthesis protein [Gordonia phthalatica]|uniref:Cobalamin biosynthesis protein CobD n=1 Tax=Gordonia phthalatica TaxID=1136941 RepID=A0A0N9NA69_9ACTN|nr:cobalamin biosynthesis protein [Gordonia phthalatica]ALG85218.1 cobalamin biosynthesis protein CobD [Gordonia phthalatica]